MLVNVIPFTRINDHISWSETICQTKNSFPPTTIRHDDYDTSSLTTQYQFADIQKSFLYVCTETVFNYPHRYLTEKSFKGITAKRPFVIVGVSGSLALLKDYGFKTFDNWWDESYDSEEDPSRRIEKIYAIIKDICARSTVELQTMCKAMAPTLDHNFQHYARFSKNEISAFDLACYNLTKTMICSR